MIAHLYKQSEAANYIAWEHHEFVRVLTKCLGRTPSQMEIYGAATLNKLRQFRLCVRVYLTAKVNELVKAARVGDVVAVKTTLNSGDIGINVMDKWWGETAWSAALGCGHQAVCEYLIKRGAKVDGKCSVRYKSHTYLVAAVLSGRLGLVRHVLALGVPSSADAIDGTIPTCALTEAVRMGSIEMIETLLELGVRFDRVRNGLQLPFFFKDLLPWVNPTSPASLDAEPCLLLCAACWFEDHSVFDYLLATYSELQDFQQKPHNAAKILCLAVYQENGAFVEELLRRGAPINCSDSFSPIVTAVKADSLRMLELLISHGADVHINCYVATYFCQSLLTAAVNWRSVDCAKRLLSLDTRPLSRNEAFVMAVKLNNHELATLMADCITELRIDDLTTCIKSTRCPLILDLLLSGRCTDQLPASSFTAEFTSACVDARSADLLGVFVAHGIDATLNTRADSNTTSNLMKGVLGYRSTDSARPVTLEFVLANGLPTLTTDIWSGRTPEAEMEARMASASDAKRKIYAACRDILAAYS